MLQPSSMYIIPRAISTIVTTAACFLIPGESGCWHWASIGFGDTSHLSQTRVGSVGSQWGDLAIGAGPGVINGIPAYPRLHRNIRQTQRRCIEWTHGLRVAQWQRMEQPRLEMSDTSADVHCLEMHG